MEIIAYAVDRGLPVDKIARCMHFHVQAGDYFFEEVAKLRAMRRMWARILTGHFGATDPASARIKYQTHTAGSSLQTKEPLNNVVRAALHTLAAVLGGVQTIHTCAYDEAIAIPAEEAAKLAIRTQQIILEESGVPEVADPLGGSYYVEWLTNQMEKQAWNYIETIQNKGGYLIALESGFLLNEVVNSAMKQQEEISSGRRVIVGVNKYVTAEDEEEIELFRHNPGTAKMAIERVRLLKEHRDHGLVDRRLGELKKALYENKNVIPFMKEAFLAEATNSEVFNVCREVLGEWRPL
jgi:methylmalonyl-CoA mutase N-terminal domain/subunit